MAGSVLLQLVQNLPFQCTVALPIICFSHHGNQSYCYYKISYLLDIWHKILISNVRKGEVLYCRLQDMTTKW